MRTLEYLIEEKDDGKTAANFLRRDKQFSYALIVKLRHSPESIKLNGTPIRTIDRIKSGELLTVEIPEREGFDEPNYDISVPVIYEDEDIIVFDKPPHMPVHPSKSHQTDTLANYYAAHYPCSKFRVIGRLDMDTSGVVVVAKNIHSAAVLTDAQMKKEYIAIAEGIPESLYGVIDEPIDDSDPSACRRFVGENGKSSYTEYEVIAKGNNIFAAKVMPKTGRTHQIRVHFSYLGYPLCGDELYGGKRDIIDRQALHRTKISFEHPITKEKMSFSSELPQDMKKIFDTMDKTENK